MKDISKKLFGQPGAINTLVDTITISRAGLREGNKTVGNYLMVGPTGVGKTELAKQLAASMGIPLVRFDMSEYMERHSIAKLIGSPAGYVGYEEEGLLVKTIEESPSCVLLLDEIEKAHPDLFNILLQVMDYGTLTSAKGKKVIFRNVVLLMSSNAGAQDLEKEPIGFGREVGSDDKSALDDAVKGMFSPEFRNRLDEVLVFNRLEPKHIKLIVKKFIGELSDMAGERDVEVTITKKATEYLTEIGYDRKMGARPMARKIHKHIKIPLSKEMLFGKIKKGGTAEIDIVDGKIHITYAVGFDPKEHDGVKPGPNKPPKIPPKLPVDEGTQ